MQTDTTFLILLCAFPSVLTAGLIAIVLSRIADIKKLAESSSPAASLDLLRADQGRIERTVREDLREARLEHAENGRALREELVATLRGMADLVLQQTGEMERAQNERFATFSANLQEVRADARRHAGQLFEIQRAQYDDFSLRVTAMSDANETRSETLRQAVEAQLTAIRKDSAEKLDQVRLTVDEKLQGTLERRLGESFKLVSERLDTVHRGLGEMQVLATGVGDLKRVLSNIKVRGSWGEVQLGALLQDVLTADQYAKNVTTSESGSERVEFAIRLPNGPDGRDLLLPIDCKFPLQDYERLQSAAEIGDAGAVENASKALELNLRASAKDICTKYINPPYTTDFAILFLPTEGLYAEIIRRPGLCDDLQRLYRVTICGPSTLAAVLSSIKMGFKTLAIQKRSSEVWQVLGAVKTEFGKFGPVLEKVKKKLQEASNHIDTAESRERAIGRKLRQVEAAPVDPDGEIISSETND